MNEINIKRLFYIGLGIEIIAGIFLISIIVTNYLFETNYLIPDLVMTIFWIGIAMSLFASLLKARSKIIMK